jgi:hypothetical protein
MTGVYAWLIKAALSPKLAYGMNNAWAARLVIRITRIPTPVLKNECCDWELATNISVSSGYYVKKPAG